jgi:pilus assembly protein CpaE
MTPRDDRPDIRSGQASVEFVAVLPALAVCLVLAGQAVSAGWALWSAGVAARAGARAAEVGGNAEAAARRALPGPLRRDALIRSGDGVRVRVRVPALLPGVQLPSVTASSTLDASAG